MFIIMNSLASKVQSVSSKNSGGYLDFVYGHTFPCSIIKVLFYSVDNQLIYSMPCLFNSLEDAIAYIDYLQTLDVRKI